MVSAMRPGRGVMTPTRPARPSKESKTSTPFDQRKWHSVEVGFDPDGRASVEWGVTGVPETYIINAQGLVTFKHAGPITAKVLKDTILPKLREASE